MEGAIAFILIYLVVFYRRIVRPMNTISSGMELLREQDFSSRLSPVGTIRIGPHGEHLQPDDGPAEERTPAAARTKPVPGPADTSLSPWGVIITTLDNEVSQLNPVALKMLQGIRPEEILGKRLGGIDSPLAKELASLSKEQTTVVRLNDANIYKCTPFLLHRHRLQTPVFPDRTHDGRSNARRETGIRKSHPDDFTRSKQHHGRHHLGPSTPSGRPWPTNKAWKTSAR